MQAEQFGHPEHQSQGQSRAEGGTQTLPRQQIPWNQVRSPGVYIETETGRLYRFLPEAIQNGSVVIHQNARAQSRLQQLSTDPYLSQQEARQRAEDAGVQAAF